MLDSQQAIALMQQQTAKQVEHLRYDDPQVTTWFQLSERIVEEAFGRNHKNYSHFVCTVGHYGASRDVHQRDFERDVRNKKAMLLAFVEELRVFPTSSDRNKPDLIQLRRKLLSEIGEVPSRPEQPYTDYKYLPSATMWAQPFILDQIEILAAEGRVDLKRLPNSDEAAVKITAIGRKSLEVEESEWQQRSSQLISHNTVNVHNSHVGNVAQVTGSTHVQIRQGDGSANLKEIFDQIDGLITQMKSSGLAPEAKADAELEAAQLKTELQKSSPNFRRIKEMLAVFGSLNSAVQFGEKLPQLVHEVMKHLNLG